MFNIFKAEVLPGTVGHLVWPMQHNYHKCPHKGYMHPTTGYRCRYCGVKLKIKMKVKG